MLVEEEEEAVVGRPPGDLVGVFVTFAIAAAAVSNYNNNEI